MKKSMKDEIKGKFHGERQGKRCNFYTQRVILASLTSRPPLSCCRHPSVEAIKGLSGKTVID